MRAKGCEHEARKECKFVLFEFTVQVLWVCVCNAGATVNLSDKHWRLPASEYLYFPGNMQLITFCPAAQSAQHIFGLIPIPIPRLGTISAPLSAERWLSQLKSDCASRFHWHCPRTSAWIGDELLRSLFARPTWRILDARRELALDHDIWSWETKLLQADVASIIYICLRKLKNNTKRYWPSKWHISFKNIDIRIRFSVRMFSMAKIQEGMVKWWSPYICVC